MSEYLPTTDEIRKTYDDGRGWQQMGHAHYVPGEFDRWLEQFRAEAKVEALREAIEELERLDDGRTSGYHSAGRHIIARLRARADEIERGAEGAEPKKHFYRNDIDYAPDGTAWSWEVVECECDQPWRHA